MTTISSYFFKNVYKVVDTPQYLSEMNKFIMFFGVDAKDYSNANVTNDTILFENGPTYKYQDGYIYRNDVVITGKILNCTFSKSEIEVGNIIKNIVNVNIQIGKNNDKSVSKNIDFTLRYW